MRLLVVVGCLILGCGSEDSTLTEEDVRREGVYCCTHDGYITSSDPECSNLSRMLTVVDDFRNVDPSGHGDACFWVLER